MTVFDRLSGGVQQQERRERFQECSEQIVCLNHGEVRTVARDGLDTCTERSEWGRRAFDS
ncbi:hypothetical protein E2C01_056863 [Portunus trituberculatus]|uniref:Uncharacterized protein n=1 Tax=Portunus trituberculatus TaxID=210409 RepID=A0A5B7GYJ8_PORTR|nr:hypothetical protein [Portunus trituberculatus]